MDLFPEIEARTLRGEKVALPADLPARRTIVVAAFQQPQQALVDRWIDAFVEEGIPPTPLGLEFDAQAAVIELPVLPSRYRMVRRFIDGGMARTIKVEEILARTWTAYTDVEKFREALSIAKPQVEVMVVSRLGEVIDRTSGEVSLSAVERLTASALEPLT